MAFCIGATPLKRDEAKRNRVCALETYVRKNEIARVKFSIYLEEKGLTCASAL